MKGKTSFHDDDEAVSPVIGVILMVAITVILAAVIGTFVLGLGQDVQTNIQAAATISCNADDGSDPAWDHEIKVTWTTNQNANKLNVSASPESAINNPDAVTDLNNVGETYTLQVIGDESIDVVVTGVDGEQRDVVQTDTCDFTT